METFIRAPYDMHELGCCDNVIRVCDNAMEAARACCPTATVGCVVTSPVKATGFNKRGKCKYQGCQGEFGPEVLPN